MTVFQACEPPRPLQLESGDERLKQSFLHLAQTPGKLTKLDPYRY